MKLAAPIAFVLLMTLPCKADDEMYKAYVLSLFSEPGKALSELETLAASSPLLMSYALALFTDQRCGTDGAFATEAGKRFSPWPGSLRQ